MSVLEAIDPVSVRTVALRSMLPLVTAGVTVILLGRLPVVPLLVLLPSACICSFVLSIRR